MNPYVLGLMNGLGLPEIYREIRSNVQVRLIHGLYFSSVYFFK